MNTGRSVLAAAVIALVASPAAARGKEEVTLASCGQSYGTVAVVASRQALINKVERCLKALNHPSECQLWEHRAMTSGPGDAHEAAFRRHVVTTAKASFVVVSLPVSRSG